MSRRSTTPHDAAHAPGPAARASLREIIQHWIERLSNPEPAFGGLPACPFAKLAHVQCFTCESADAALDLLARLDSVDDRSVLILAFEDGVDVDPGAVAARANGFLAPRGLVAMESDPKRPMIIGGARTTQGARPLILVQSRRALEEASALLENTGYYAHWTEADRKRVKP